jgi:hypothetical protein
MKDVKSLCPKTHSSDADTLDMPSKIDHVLRPEVLDDIQDMGFRDTMIKEYSEMAQTLGRVLDLVEENNFQSVLSEADRIEYENLLLWLGVCARRYKILINESEAMDMAVALAVAQPESACVQ